MLLVPSTPRGLATAAESVKTASVRIPSGGLSAGAELVVKLLRAYRSAEDVGDRAPSRRDATWDGRLGRGLSPVALASDWSMPSLRCMTPSSGRLDARRVAEHFGLPLKRLAEMLERNYPTVHKTPDSEALQEPLRSFSRIAWAFGRLFGDDGALRVWLNAPHPDLDGASPLELLEAHKPEIVIDLLEDSLAGHPG